MKIRKYNKLNRKKQLIDKVIYRIQKIRNKYRKNRKKKKNKYFNSNKWRD